MYKVFTNKVPKCVVKLFIKLSAHSFKQLGNTQYDFVIVRCNTSLKQSFLVCNGVKQWNNLPIIIKLFANLCC